MKKKRNPWVIVLIVLIGISVGGYVLYPRMMANIVQDRNIFDFDDSDDAPNNNLIETTSFDRQTELGMLNLFYMMCSWVIGGTIIAILLNYVFTRSGWRKK